jgi:hypothetical protein
MEVFKRERKWPCGGVIIKGHHRNGIIELIRREEIQEHGKETKGRVFLGKRN